MPYRLELLLPTFATADQAQPDHLGVFNFEKILRATVISLESTLETLEENLQWPGGDSSSLDPDQLFPITSDSVNELLINLNQAKHALEKLTQELDPNKELSLVKSGLIFLTGTFRIRKRVFQEVKDCLSALEKFIQLFETNHGVGQVSATKYFELKTALLQILKKTKQPDSTQLAMVASIFGANAEGDQ